MGQFAKVDLNSFIRFQPTVKGLEYLNNQSREFCKAYPHCKPPTNWVSRLKDGGYLHMQIHEFIRQFSNAGYELDNLININVEVEYEELIDEF